MVIPANSCPSCRTSPAYFCGLSDRHGTACCSASSGLFRTLVYCCPEVHGMGRAAPCQFLKYSITSKILASGNLRKGVLCLLMLSWVIMIGGCGEGAYDPPPTWLAPATPTATVAPTATSTMPLPTLAPTRVVTSTPKPANLVTVAAMAMTATDQALKTGTPTPLGVRLVTATPPVVITATPQPQNTATATFMAELATAQAFLYGTPTPFPAGIVIATPSPAGVPTPIMMCVPTAPPRLAGTPGPAPSPFASLAPPDKPAPARATSTMSPTLPLLPEQVKINFLFMTGWIVRPRSLAVDPDGGNLANPTHP